MTQQIVIEPSQGWAKLGLRELWDSREVVFYLAWRDIKVRYKQTIFGASWAILQPLATMVIFTIIFSRVAKLPSDGIPYPIFSFAALVPWTMFASSVSKGSLSLAGAGALLKQIYFPRLALPIASLLGSLFDFMLAFSILLIMMAYYGIAPTINIVFLPFLMLLALGTALGSSMVLAAMNVQFRDVRHAVGFMIQAWMYATPVVYPLSMIQDPIIRAIYALNPMVGVIEGFRWALLGVDTSPGPSIIISIVVTLGLLFFGASYFKRIERTFADVA